MKPVPDRCASNKRSPFYDADCLRLNVVFNGELQTRVIEYSISGGWIRRYKIDANGQPVKNMIGTGYAVERKHGKVEVSWK